MSSSTPELPHGRDTPSEQFVSVMRSSYIHHKNAELPVPSSVRRERELAESQRQRQTSPVFIAKSNYEYSFTNSVTPPPAHSMKPPAREVKHLPFFETSTSRASYQQVDASEYPQRVKGNGAKGAISPLKFVASSESRKAFVKHDVPKPQHSKGFDNRPLPHVPFTATTTNKADFKQFPAASDDAGVHH